MPRHASIVLASLCAAAVAVATAASAGAAIAASRSAAVTASAGCRNGTGTNNWRAVFGHESNLIKAKATVKSLAAYGYKTAKIENRGCNDYALVLESPAFSDFKIRASFAQEALKAKLVISYAQPGTTRTKPGEVNIIFGHSTTLGAAVKMLKKVAQSGWREADIFYVNASDWTVVWPHVPGSAADATVQSAFKLGLTPEVELIGQ